MSSHLTRAAPSHRARVSHDAAGNVKKAAKLLEGSLDWRAEWKPEVRPEGKEAQTKTNTTPLASLYFLSLLSPCFMQHTTHFALYVPERTFNESRRSGTREKENKCEATARRTIREAAP